MAVYVYRCAVHGEREYRRPMADVLAPAYCEDCGVAMAKVPTAPATLVPQSYPDVVRDTLNREHPVATRQALLMAGGLERPKPEIAGVGFTSPK